MKYAAMVVLMSASISAAADDAESKKLLKDLEGSYKVAAAEKLGEATPPGYIDALEKISIKGDQLSFFFKGEGAKVVTISVDAAKKPAHINLKTDVGPNKGIPALGIIAIDGEMVKLCYNNPADQKRPTQFKTSKDDRNILLTLKRTKE